MRLVWRRLHAIVRRRTGGDGEHTRRVPRQSIYLDSRQLPAVLENENPTQIAGATRCSVAAGIRMCARAATATSCSSRAPWECP